MPSSIFAKKNQRQNDQSMFAMMMATNPRFAEFVRENQGLTPEQIMGKYNVDPNLLGRFLSERR